MMDMLFMKCRSRQEQAILVGGMLFLTVVCYFVGQFFWGMMDAAHQTIVDGDASGHREVGRMRGYGVIGVGVCGFLGLLFGAMGFVNGLRLLTGTGIVDPDEDDGWSC